MSVASVVFFFLYYIQLFLFERKSCKKKQKTCSFIAYKILRVVPRVLLSAIFRLKERGSMWFFVQGRVIHVGEIGISQTCSRSLQKAIAERR
jgi:hypothetical protein